MLERRSDLKRGIKEMFAKHDVDRSGTLEARECERALNDYLPGFDPMEYVRGSFGVDTLCFLIGLNRSYSESHTN